MKKALRLQLAKWRVSDPEKRIKLAVVTTAFMIGAVVVVALRDTPLIRAPHEIVSDTVLNIAQGHLLPRGAHKIVTVDIDDATALAWHIDAADRTPMPALADTVATLLRAKPAFLVIDVDVEKSRSGQDALAQLLVDANAIGSTNILLVKTSQSEKVAAAGATPVFNQSFLDPVVAPGAPAHSHLFWFDSATLADEDGVRRQIASWTVGCEAVAGHYRSSTVFAPGIIVRMVSEAQGGRASLDRLGDQLAAPIADCGEAPPVPGARPAPSTGTARWLHSAMRNPALTGRIAYADRNLWRDKNAGPITPKAYAAAPLIKISVATMADKGHVFAPYDNIMRGQIVILGRSDSDNLDHFSSPIGPVPGLAIVAESIRTVIDYNPLLPSILSTALGLLLAYGLLIAEVLLKPRGVKLIGWLIGVPTAFILIFLISFVCGWWFDVVLPLFLMGAIAALAEPITHEIQQLKKKGAQP